MRSTVLTLLTLGILFSGSEALAKKPRKKAEVQAPAAEPTHTSLQRPTRLDFTDPHLVQGQTNRAGSVYLYDRKQLQLRSMVKMREDFRDEIAL